jgi:hypothetical protein
MGTRPVSIFQTGGSMSYQAVVINVMIASPSDVSAERSLIPSVIHIWNAVHAADRQQVLLPIAWETHASPKTGDRGQGVINEQLLQHCDLLVAIFWAKLGSPTGEAESGTVEEIEKHIAAGKPAMLYFSSAPVHYESVDPDQYKALLAFRDKMKSAGLYESYETLADFREKFERQLAQTIIRYYSNLKPPDSSSLVPVPLTHTVQVGDSYVSGGPKLSEQARQLLLKAVATDDGTIICIHTMGGLHVQVGSEGLAETRDAREQAKWKAAVSELVSNGYIEDRGYKGEVFVVTNAGYEVADRLK